ncbi:MAG: protein-L-isoaspartate O-methyltransferase [Gammaproteobacteria bacterium]|nr:protein-L-isoaspartate O-methyltransferase [Gammaproteobacteria bacterium]MDH5594384.1 protein-L-isoaspartate O-methyltransferase [Gammaproteobacteria bacterium]MDH5614167.1 protein-L-isoaspartate O-methyltransferase [Gammaproteobacteria bacterium]
MSHLDVSKARINMIEQQIRPWEVLDQRVLDVMEQIPREEFVPEGWRNLAFADINIPLNHDEVMMEPRIEARMLQALNIRSSDSILEVGTGSGYITALLTKLGKHVVSVDIHADNSQNTAQKLENLGIHNVTLETGDASAGWDQHAPYDVIAITGSIPSLPEAFQFALNRGGRLFCVIGESPVMTATLITRIGEYEWTHEALFETELQPLQNIAPTRHFSL